MFRLLFYTPLLIPFAGFLGAVLISPTLFADASVEQDARPVVLMLRITDSDCAATEEALQMELALGLESHSLKVEPSFEFKEKSLTDRTRQMRQAARQYGADAVFWIEKREDNTITLQLVVLAPGRSTVRSVDTDLADESIGELAIAMREILANIDVMVTADAPVSPSPSADPPAQWTTVYSKEQFQLQIAAEISHGMAPHKNDGPIIGGGIGATFNFPKNIHMDLLLSATATPDIELKDATVQSLVLRPGLALGYFWKSAELMWGPSLMFAVPWQQTILKLDTNDRTKRHWSFDVTLSPIVEARLRVAEGIYLLCRGGALIYFQRRVFKRITDSSVLYQRAYLSWHYSLGIVFSLN